MPKKKQETSDLNKLPSKIKCVKCAKECGVRLDVLEARIKLHGSLEKLQAEYFCRNCRKSNTYIVNDKPVVKKSSNGQVISPLMRRCLNREMWWQQPGFIFPGSGGDKYGPAVGPEMTFKRNETGELVAVPVKGASTGSVANLPPMKDTEE